MTPAEVKALSPGQLEKLADDVRARNGKSIDMLFREVFRC